MGRGSAGEVKCGKQIKGFEADLSLPCRKIFVLKLAVKNKTGKKNGRGLLPSFSCIVPGLVSQGFQMHFSSSWVVIALQLKNCLHLHFLVAQKKPKRVRMTKPGQAWRFSVYNCKSMQMRKYLLEIGKAKFVAPCPIQAQIP